MGLISYYRRFIYAAIAGTLTKRDVDFMRSQACQDVFLALKKSKESRIGISPKIRT